MQFGLSESVAYWGRYRGDRRAVLANGEAMSYGSLNANVDRLVPLLLDVPAHRVAVACGSKLSLLVGILAGLRANKSVVLVNGGLTDDALKTNLADADVSALLHDETSDRLPSLIRERGGRSVGMLARGGPLASTPPPSRPTDEWGVLYSSGTTGTPKGIERDQESMVTEFLGWILELGLNRDSTFYIGRPIYYTGGLVLAGATLLAGGVVILDDIQNENDPDQAWDALSTALREVEVDWAFFIPDQLRAFTRSKRMASLPRTPKNVLVMGGPISGDEKLAVSRLLHCNVIESWGNSESLGTITEAEDLVTRPNSIGRPFLCDELYIVDEDLQPVPPGTRGRIAGSIEAGFLRYSNRPEATEQARREGLIISEDFGYQDGDGYFYILGRVSDNVVRNGQSLFLSQIESHLRANEQITECCVTSAGDEASVLIVVLVPPAVGGDAEALRARINASLPEAERVDRVVVTELPRVPSGKIDRLACKRLAVDTCHA